MYSTAYLHTNKVMCIRYPVRVHREIHILGVWDTIKEPHCRVVVCIYSYRKLGIAPPTSKHLQPTLDIRPYHRDVARKLTDGDQEVAKQDEQAVEFYQKPSQGPAEENKEDTSGESSSALEFLRAREEDRGFPDANNQSQSDEKEDLALSVRCNSFVRACGTHFPWRV